MQRVLVFGLFMLLTNWSFAQQRFNYTGGDQTYLVPTGVTTVKVYMWGAGGGGGDKGDSNNNPRSITHGGGGGYVEGLLCVTPGEVLTLIVGQGGGYGYYNRATYGGGGEGGHGIDQANSMFTGAGGGRSAIRRVDTELATAGAGGGGGETRDFNNNYARGGVGGAGGGIEGYYGSDYGYLTYFGGNGGGKGGTQLAGGAGANVNNIILGGKSGSLYKGGAGNSNKDREGGGGGGGYYGGGGGAGRNDNYGGGGGGGGSSYIGGLINGFTLAGGNGITTSYQSQQNAANFNHIYNNSSYGKGGNVNSPGQAGLIVIVPMETIALSSVVGTDNQTVCINTAITNITYTTTGVTGATFSNLPAGVVGSWSNNVITISGTPSAGGTYSITTTGGTCASTITRGTITVTPANTIALSSLVGTDSQTVCINTAITPIKYNTTGATGATFSGLPTGVAGSLVGNIVTISGTPSTAGGTYTITLTGGCGLVTKTGTITVNPTSVGGTVSSATTICSGSTSGLLKLAGNTGTVVRWESSVSPFTSWTTISNTNTTYTSAALTETTQFRAVVQSGVCVTANSAPVLIKVFDAVQNNYLSYSNGTSGQSNATPSEGGNAVLTAPAGTYFATVNFASYGTPTGIFPNFVVNPTCHSITSQTKSEELLLGKTDPITIPATNAVFQDPCQGTLKKLFVIASYAQNICNGTSVSINGTVPTGGTGVYTYQWESSIISATTGFVAAEGTNKGINYTSGSLTKTTWFRRIVTSCGVNSTSSIVMVIVNSVITPTFTTVPQAQTCADEHISYATQTGQSNYVWTVSGSVGVDYNLIARGTNTNHDIVVEWLTAGNKTVSVNYSNEKGCSAATPAIYSTEVLVIDQGRVKGGGDFCEGTALPLLTLYSIAGDNISYPNPALVLKWQQSDDENVTWTDIPNTNGKVNYTPTVFLGAFRTYRVILQNGPCSKTAIESRVTIKTVTAPLLGAITQPTCISSISSVVLTGLSSSGTIIQTGSVNATYSITGGGSQIISGLSAGTYKFAVQSEVCSSSTTSEVVISPVTNTWNGTSWSDAGKLPTTGQAIVFAGDYTSTGDLEGCSCIVNTGKTVVFKSVGAASGHTLKITNKLEVLGTGSLTMENNTNLIQVNDVMNSGKVTVKREVVGLRNSPGNNPLINFVDYVYWSSPVADQITKGVASGAFSPGTPPNRFYSYRESNDRFYETGDLTFTAGRGYAVRAEGNQGAFPHTAPYTKMYKFTGKPNNGDISFPITRSSDNPIGVEHGYNLVGNPYPSNINFDVLYAGNSGLIYNTVWFWTNASYEQYQLGSSYGGNNYAVYNGSGGNNATTNVKIQAPNGIIKVGQGFLVQKKDLLTAPLHFKHSYPPSLNNLRVASTGTFYQRERVGKNRFWLSLRSPSDLINTQLVAYVTGASNGYEQDYDAEAFDNYSDLFYSIIPDKKLVIQGRGENFTIEDKVILGANFFQTGSYTIALDQPEGIFGNGQDIYLKDKQEATITNLSLGSYTFNTTKGDNSGRFEIIYKPETVLVTEAITKENIIVYRDGDDFVIKSDSKKINYLEVYDGVGRMLYGVTPNQKEVRIYGSTLVNGIYLLKISQDGKVITKKIIR